MDKKIIKKLIKSSKEVFKNSSLMNGAIVAANTDLPDYPRQAGDYRYVWPRDAAYICVAANIAGVKKIQKPYLKWLLECPEDFKKEKKLFQNYSTNGRKKYGQFQPDQAGVSLWMIYELYKNDKKSLAEQYPLIERLADGLVKEWKGEYFWWNTNDLWEEGNRRTSTKVKNNFTYSLAACAKGLQLANLISPNERWIKASEQMIEKIDEAYNKKEKRFLRNHGLIDDFNIDASLLGLVYPFDIIKADDPRIASTVEQMEKHIVLNGGVHRYQFDYYDGDGTGEEGSGVWPLLNFWMSIYWAKRGDKKKSLGYYEWVVNKLDSLYIPEQLFEDNLRIGIKPLVWSHAMFIIASKFLGFL